jgi:hypothetical protein
MLTWRGNCLLTALIENDDSEFRILLFDREIIALQDAGDDTPQ